MNYGATKWDKFARNLSEVRPPPCSFCRHHDRCAEEELACQPFGSYVRGKGFRMPRTIEPTRELFKRIFREEDADDV